MHRHVYCIGYTCMIVSIMHILMYYVNMERGRERERERESERDISSVCM